MTSGLTAKERARLKARAHGLEPVVHMGTAGLTPNVVAEVDRALTAHELIKVRIAAADRAERIALGNDLCTRSNASAVHRVGKVLILWRPRAEDEEDAS